MIVKHATIINKLGLHARAAAKFCSTASLYSSSVLIKRNTMQVNGKSIMGVMMLAAAKGSEVELSIEGEDEEQAMQAILELINNRFDESE